MTDAARPIQGERRTDAPTADTAPGDAVAPAPPGESVAPAVVDPPAEDGLPLHRVASTAVLAGAGAGPLAVASLAVTGGLREIGRASSVAAGVAALVASCGLSRSVGRWWRVPLVALGGALLTLLGVGAMGWVHAIDGGAEAAWLAAIRELERLPELRSMLGLGLVTTLPLLATLRARVLRDPRWAGVRWQAAAGALGGLLLLLGAMALRGPRPEDFGLILAFVVAGALLGGWLGLADRVEACLAERLARREDA